MSKLSLLTSFWRNKNEYQRVFTREKLNAFTRMLPLIFTGDYKPRKKRNLIIGFAAIMYVLSPIDIIPEIVLGPFGLLDDFAIILFAIKRLEKEVINFLAWEEQQRNILFID